MSEQTLSDSPRDSDRTMTCKACGLKLTATDLLKATQLRDQHEHVEHSGASA